MRFEHLHASHCESGVMASLLRHQGLPISEAMTFGLSSALCFAYLPFLRTLPYTFPAPNWNQIPNPFYLSGCTACAR